jgi:hypothetical protein
LKRLDTNVYETDDGAVISRRERDYLTFALAGRQLRLPVEATVRTVEGNPKFGLSIGTGGALRWSDGITASQEEIERTRTEIRRAFEDLGTPCSFTT